MNSFNKLVSHLAYVMIIVTLFRLSDDEQKAWDEEHNKYPVSRL